MARSRYWVVLLLVVALDLIPRTHSLNVDEGRSRRRARQRIGGVTTGLLRSDRPIDPSRGRRRQQSHAARHRTHRDSITEERINELTALFKSNVDRLRSMNQLDLIFVIDESSSVGLANFLDEIRFVSRFVSGIEVDMNHTRVAVVTYADNVTSWTNQVSMGEIHAHKCSLLGQDLPSIVYAGGGTFTQGALARAKDILENAREDSTKVVFLITDGESNGGSPRKVADDLKRSGVEIFTFGVKDGNRDELTAIASTPIEGHRLILNSFKEFEAVARRALHSDLESGNFIIEDDMHCDKYCADTNCCHATADCRCGTTTGKYACVCKPGYYGAGLRQDSCQACPAGTYKRFAVPGDVKTCLPCPDERMTSPEGAMSLDQCTCNEGYKKENDRCEPLMCEALSPPDNGRFLACDRRYRSTCTFACDIGYDLEGTATIACNEDELWTTLDGTEKQEALCQVRYCEALETPDRGTVSCSNDDNSYSTVCTFECNEGYKLFGSSSRMCDANRHWTGADAECKEIRCPAIPTPTYGMISGECARGERGRYGDECQFSCPSDGFELLGPETITCLNSGQWQPPVATGRQKICNDTAPPELTCPPDMTVSTITRKAFAYVTWPQPVVTDNSEVVTLTPAWVFPVTLRIGKHVMTYTATDDFGLTTQCEFTVTVKDVEPPTIDHCRGPLPIVIEKGEMQAEHVEWRIPRFLDNSGSVTMTGNASFGTFPIGLTEVQYVARDAAGNTRSCIIDIIVQDNTCTPTLPNPRGGHIDCRVVHDDTECEMHCDTERFGFALVPLSYGNPLYTCKEGTESWDPRPTIPNDCSRQKFSSAILKDIQVTYDMTNKQACNDTDFLEGVRQAFIDFFAEKISQLCVGKVGGRLTCSLIDVSVKCIGIVVEDDYHVDHGDVGDTEYDEYDLYDYGEEESARRRKRSTRGRSRKHSRPKRQIFGQEQVPAYDDTDDIYGDDNYDVGETVPLATLTNADAIGSPDVDVTAVFNGNDEIPQDEISDFINEAMPDIIPPHVIANVGEEQIKERLEITLTIRGEVVMDGMNHDIDRIRHQNMVEIIRNIDLEGNFSGLASNIYANSINSTDGDFINYVEETYSHTDELICPIGTVLRNSALCVNCPVGTYYDVISANCVSCPIGYYQDSEAQLSCQSCPIDTNTIGIHSRDLSDCLDLCGPGFYSDTGVETCNGCPQGFFVDYYGATKCAKCPEGTGTIGVATHSPDDCGELCKPGYVSPTGFPPCQPCPQGTIQEKSGKTFCYVCQENQGVDMDDFVVCPDIRPGTMEDFDRLYYNECFAKPCKNNATCAGQGTTFTCKCQPGYTGDLCEIEIDECELGLCAETATCVDLLNAFRCECAPGFTGTLCEEEINECLSEPCENGASCVDRLNAFSCDCSTGYEGFLCSIDIDDCAENSCQNNGTCIDEVAGFHCDCAVGFEGVICETNTDDCAGEPCLNGATCIDGISEFRCDCKPGFTGLLCGENIDECSSDPCVNGECMDLIDSYKCLCPPTYLGVHCDDVGDPYFDLYFGRANTYHHVKLDYALPNMTEVTVSFYLRSNSTETYGTPFSYAVGDGKAADTLTLTDLSALTLYINGEFVVTDSRPINDGQWYFVTVIWTSEEGRWYIYLDGQLEDSGEGLATGQAIPGGGTLVIGQEQDTLGGGFSSSQEFLGTLSQFNIHDYAFNANQVLLLWRNCANHVGNIRAWPEMGGGIIGKIERKPTEFCLPCPTIESDNGTVVRIENDYSISITCSKGYELVYRGMKRRLKTVPFRCGSDGTWKFRGNDVDVSLLRCRRISCPDLEEVGCGKRR